MFKHEEFLQAVKNDGLAKQNRFFINMALPNIVGDSAVLFGSAGQMNRNLHMFCKSVDIPGVSIMSQDIRTHGEIYHGSFDRAFSGANFTFYVDRNLYIRKFFDDWVNAIQNPFNRNMGYYKDYVSPNVSVLVCDKQDLVNYMIVLWDVSIKTVGALNLDQASSDPMVIDIGFDYTYYTTFAIPQADTGYNGEGSIDSALYTTGTGETYLPQANNRITTLNGIPGNQRLAAVSGNLSTAASQFQNTIGSTFGTIRSAITGYQNDFLSFQRQISQGLGVLNGVGSDIRSVLNAPRDLINSGKSTIGDVKWGIKEFKGALRL